MASGISTRRTGRRGNGEGSITFTGDRWQARITLENGKRKALYGKTRQEVQRKLTAVLRDRDKGLPIGMDERQSLATYLNAWLETVKPTVRPRTWKRYAELMNQQVVRR